MKHFHTLISARQNATWQSVAFGTICGRRRSECRTVGRTRSPEWGGEAASGPIKQPSQSSRGPEQCSRQLLVWRVLHLSEDTDFCQSGKLSRCSSPCQNMVRRPPEGLSMPGCRGKKSHLKCHRASVAS